MADALLIELGTEELPPKALDTLSQAFVEAIRDGLAQHGVAADLAGARRYCTPRRLAAYIPEVAGRQADQHIERRGPSVKAGCDADGQPTRALTGFAASCGVEPDALETMATDKGDWFVYRATQPGKSLDELLPGILEAAVKALPIPRPMRWGDHDYSFVRPVHWLVILHGERVIDAELLGLSSGRMSHGHRFHHPEPINVANADTWLDALRQVHVLADPDERRQCIRDQVAGITVGGEPRLHQALLDELANLVEWPAAIGCSFEPDFLRVPAEALVATMEADQKFIPVFHAEGQLSEYFIGIANIDSRDKAAVRAGYERVIRPRFADARFFYEEDLKTRLDALQPELERVTYQQAVGSLWDKSCRVAELARVIANRMQVDAGEATRAASLAKCDLLTRMVGEFPSLQGTMGRYYAAAQGESSAIANALDEYYMPRHAADRIAEGPLARALAIADRLDTLAGIFAVGLKPTGNKDPFALRRAALGLARTLIEGDIELDMEAVLIEALELIPEPALAAGVKAGKGNKPPALDAAARRRELLQQLQAFILDRLRGYYAGRGFTPDQFEAVAAVAPSSLVDFDRRLQAVAAFEALPAATNLAAANKRVANILRKSAEGASLDGSIDQRLLQDDAENALAVAMAEKGAQSATQCAAGDYSAALCSLAELQPVVARFFDEVMVMSDDAALRANRLALLAGLRACFMQIADIGRLQG